MSGMGIAAISEPDLRRGRPLSRTRSPGFPDSPNFRPNVSTSTRGVHAPRVACERERERKRETFLVCGPNPK